MSTRDITRGDAASSPFSIDVGHVLTEGAPEGFRRVGSAPERIGAEMIGVEPGREVVVEGTLTPLGGGVMVDADVTAPLSGTCARCLADLSDELSVHVSAVFSAGDGFIVDVDGDDGDLGEAAPAIVDDRVDITQAVIDEAVLGLPFNPTCADSGAECGGGDVPAPDGISGEEEPPADPRWAALAERFGDLGGGAGADGPGGAGAGAGGDADGDDAAGADDHRVDEDPASGGGKDGRR